MQVNKYYVMKKYGGVESELHAWSPLHQLLWVVDFASGSLQAPRRERRQPNGKIIWPHNRSELGDYQKNLCPYWQTEATCPVRITQIITWYDNPNQYHDVMLLWLYDYGKIIHHLAVKVTPKQAYVALRGPGG
jgi:hypothetical protein